MAGIPDAVIQKLPGHASVRRTQEIYMQLTGGAEKRAVSNMDEILESVAVEKAKGSGDQEVSPRYNWCARTDSNCRPSGS
jgi:hypothetical protein